MNTGIGSLYEFVLQQMAAESYLEGIAVSDPVEVRLRLTLGANREGYQSGSPGLNEGYAGLTRMTEQQVDEFLAKFRIVHQWSDNPSPTGPARPIAPERNPAFPQLFDEDSCEHWTVSDLDPKDRRQWQSNQRIHPLNPIHSQDQDDQGRYTPLQFHGADTMLGGDSQDIMLGQGADDELFGGDGNDKLWGDDQVPTETPSFYHGNDYVDGGDRNDWIVATTGSRLSMPVDFRWQSPKDRLKVRSGHAHSLLNKSRRRRKQSVQRGTSK